MVCSAATDPAQNFKDSAEFYRFMADDGHEGSKEKDRKQTLTPMPSKKNFSMVNDTPCKTFTVSMCAVNECVCLCVCMCVFERV